jgi:hypothetical protein
MEVLQIQIRLVAIKEEVEVGLMVLEVPEVLAHQEQETVAMEKPHLFQV